VAVLLQVVLARRSARLVILLFWWWIGWHFLVEQRWHASGCRGDRL